MQEREIQLLLLNMATKCFALDVPNNSHHTGIAPPQVIEEVQRDWITTEQHCVSRMVDVVSMDAAMRLAIIQRVGF